MKKIAIVVTTVMRRQGITSVILNLLKNMQRDELKIIFLTASPVEDWFIDELVALNIEFIAIKANRIRKVYGYIKELSGLLKKNGIEVVHVHGNSATMWLEIFAAKFAGVKTRIAHSHSSSCKSRMAHYLLRPMLIHDMTMGIGCSDLSMKFAFNNKKSIILNNSIITEKFAFNADVRNTYRKNFNIETKFAIGHVGNLVYPKNHIFICEIANELKNRDISNVKFFFVGEGGDREKIEKYIKDNNLVDFITLLGVRDDVHNLYQMFDLFIMPSFFEGFPMVLIEAQTSGLHCLISDKVTKTTDILGNAEFLSIDECQSISLWADKISNVIGGGDLVKRINAITMVEAAGYSVNQNANILSDIYVNLEEVT